MTELDVDQWAERAKRARERLDKDLAAIMAALNVDGLAGWNDWNQYAANGEWN